MTRLQAATIHDRTTPPNALTVDVEEWFHAHNLNIPREHWAGLPSRLEQSVEQLLAMFEEHDVRGTFFVLGWVASRLPGTIREIHARGHEIACHGYAHVPITELSPAQFHGDVRAAQIVIEDTIGARVRGYRAPSYSIGRQTLWALDTLQELGFTYDSSVYPALAPHGRYGLPGAPLRPFQHPNGLWEFPLPVVRWLRLTVPVATGAYLRIWPLAVTARAFTQYGRAGIPLVVNVHPWELDPGQPRVHAAPFKRLLHYANLATTGTRLRHLLERHRFTTLSKLHRRYSDHDKITAPRSLPRSKVLADDHRTVKVMVTERGA